MEGQVHGFGLGNLGYVPQSNLGDVWGDFIGGVTTVIDTITGKKAQEQEQAKAVAIALETQKQQTSLKQIQAVGWTKSLPWIVGSVALLGAVTIWAVAKK